MAFRPIRLVRRIRPVNLLQISSCLVSVFGQRSVASGPVRGGYALAGTYADSRSVRCYATKHHIAPEECVLNLWTVN